MPEDNDESIPLTAGHLYQKQQDYSLDMSLELKPDIEDEDESENYSVQTPDVVLESDGPQSFE